MIETCRLPSSLHIAKRKAADQRRAQENEKRRIAGNHHGRVDFDRLERQQQDCADYYKALNCRLIMLLASHSWLPAHEWTAAIL
jgi:hypothetical protein